jgi:hypothetical protein
VLQLRRASLLACVRSLLRESRRSDDGANGGADGGKDEKLLHGHFLPISALRPREATQMERRTGTRRMTRRGSSRHPRCSAPTG